MGHKKIKKTKFRAWHVTLPITAIAFALFFYFLAQTNTMMNTEENPFGALGLLMVYGVYMGIPLLVGIVMGIVTIVLAATNK